MAWHEEYERKRVSPEEAVKVIKSGDTVVIPIDTEPRALSKALMNRRSELEDVTIMFRQPRDDCGWFKEEVGSPFRVVLDTQAGSGTEALVQKTVDYIPFLTSLRFRQATCRPHAKNDVSRPARRLVDPGPECPRGRLAPVARPQPRRHLA